jgi:dTDP-glucose 4,6-dehydratase
VDDLIEGIYRLMMSDYHDPVNIGNPAEISINDLAELINELTGNTAGTVVKLTKRLSSDPQRRQPDITRARAILNWEPTISLREGLLATIPYFRK